MRLFRSAAVLVMCVISWVCLSAESPREDGQWHWAATVVWKAAWVTVLQIHAGGWREGRVRVIQVSGVVQESRVYR